MATRHSSSHAAPYQFGESPEGRADEALRYQKRIAGVMQRADERQGRVGALRELAKKNGAPTDDIREGMSKADVQDRTDRINRSGGSRGEPTAGIDNPPPINNTRGEANGPLVQPTRSRAFSNPTPVTGLTGNKASDAANLAQNRRLYQPGGTQGEAQAPAPAARATPRPPALDVNSNGVQQALNNVPSTASAIAEQKASGQTPFGTASARFAKPGENLTAATTTDTGVQRAAPMDWQQQVMKEHPQIAIAGSPENLAFVKAHQDATAGGKPFDPHELAATVMQNMDTTNERSADQITDANRPMTGKAIAKQVGLGTTPTAPVKPGIVDRYATAGANAIESLGANPVSGLARRAWDATKNVVNGLAGTPLRNDTASSPVSAPAAAPVPTAQTASAPPPDLMKPLPPTGVDVSGKMIRQPMITGQGMPAPVDTTTLGTAPPAANPTVTTPAKPPATAMANPLDDEERKRRMAQTSPSGAAFSY